MFDFAPKDLPWNTGPSYCYSVSDILYPQASIMLLRRTLIVNVALSWDTGVARGRVTGIVRPALPSTVARVRTCPAILVRE